MKKNSLYFLLLLFIKQDFVMCSKAYFPKMTFKNYREIIGNTSRLYSTPEMLGFIMFISSNTSKAETGSQL